MDSSDCVDIYLMDKLFLSGTTEKPGVVTQKENSYSYSIFTYGRYLQCHWVCSSSTSGRAYCRSVWLCYRACCSVPYVLFDNWVRVAYSNIPDTRSKIYLIPPSIVPLFHCLLLQVVVTCLLPWRKYLDVPRLLGLQKFRRGCRILSFSGDYFLWLACFLLMRLSFLLLPPYLNQLVWCCLHSRPRWWSAEY